MSRENDGIGDLMRGALAGIAATWVMGKVTTVMYENEDEAARRMEDEAREGKTAYGVAAEKAARIVGRELTKAERESAGSAIHWALGASAGATYSALRHRVPGVDAGSGLVFGAAFFLLADEAGNVALGLTPGPRAFPWQAHARGLVGHLVFGVAAEVAIRGLERVSR
ncbi:MAG TPA: DUF1440 domain-containing protein [Longimicrobiaceae bacterium]|nr:DUF1440 domain-containing protein [Longimicrobiaceae bacterium]